MSVPFALSDAQRTARRYLDDYYAGDVVIDAPAPLAAGAVRMTVCWDSDNKARWIVEHDGRISWAWDPDHALNGYERRRTRR